MTAQIEKNDSIRNPIISPYGTSSIIVKNVIHTAKFAIQLHVAAKLLPRPLKCNGQISELIAHGVEPIPTEQLKRNSQKPKAANHLPKT